MDIAEPDGYDIPAEGGGYRPPTEEEKQEALGGLPKHFTQWPGDNIAKKIGDTIVQWRVLIDCQAWVDCPVCKKETIGHRLMRTCDDGFNIHHYWCKACNAVWGNHELSQK